MACQTALVIKSFFTLFATVISILIDFDSASFFNTHFFYNMSFKCLTIFSKVFFAHFTLKTSTRIDNGIKTDDIEAMNPFPMLKEIVLA